MIPDACLDRKTKLRSAQLAAKILVSHSPINKDRARDAERARELLQLRQTGIRPPPGDELIDVADVDSGGPSEVSLSPAAEAQQRAEVREDQCATRPRRLAYRSDASRISAVASSINNLC